VKKILLAVTGGIAAYKAIDLTSKLTQSGYEVRVMLTNPDCVNLLVKSIALYAAMPPVTANNIFFIFNLP
jgi:phosphopantothenoylcysteine synthetase/decarboxylase